MGDSVGRLNIETLTDIYASDKVKVEGISGFGVSLARAKIETNTVSGIVLNGAILENVSGDIYLTTRQNQRVSPSANLFTAAALSGGGAVATATLNADNKIIANDAVIRGADVHLLAGKDSSGVTSQLGGSTNTEITTVALAGISYPDPDMTINENNRIEINGTSVVEALEDVELITKKALSNAKISGLTLNLSLLPYGFDINEDIDPITQNTVTVGELARVASAINNISQMRILPMQISGVAQLDSARLDTELTLQEKLDLGLSPNVSYHYARLNLALGTDADAQALIAELTDKFYVVKPVELEAPNLKVVNLTTELLAQKEIIEEWIISHGSNAEAVARYQVQLQVIVDLLNDLGLISTSVSETGETIEVVQKELSVLLLEIPNIYAVPGSIFIEAKDTDVAEINALVGTQLVAAAGAEIQLINQSPFAMRIDELALADNRRIDLIDGELVTFQPGNVYLNKNQLTSAEDNTNKQITVVQDSLGYDAYGINIAVPEGLPQDIYINGSVRNENGAVTIINQEGSVNITGELLAQALDIQAAGNFSLNVDDWFHLNDPRQYVDYTIFRNQVRTEDGATKLLQAASFDVVMAGLTELESAIFDQQQVGLFSQGRIDITARYLNINGIIQSGLHEVILTIESDFNPSQSTSFTDTEGNLIAGIDFTAGGEALDGYFDLSQNAIVLEDIVANAGRITLAGQILSTGGGMIRAADGRPYVEINNNSSYDLILSEIDLASDQLGTITLIDTVTLEKTEYLNYDDYVEQNNYTGALVNGRVVYTLDQTTQHNPGDILTYQPQLGRYYVWTEGQEATEVLIETYENKAFDFGWFGEADALVKDEFKADSSFEFRDEKPLLESEVAVSEGEAELPTYAIGDVLTVEYRRLDDRNLSVFQNITKVLHNGMVFLYIGANDEIILPKSDYSDTSLWEFAYNLANNDPEYSEFKANTNNKYESSFVNFTETIINEEEGGGFFTKKTYRTIVTKSSGVKDYYTFTLKADYPIGIEFLRQVDSGLVINSESDIRFNGNVQTPSDTSGVELSVGGAISSSAKAVIFGGIEEIVAIGDIELTLRGGDIKTSVSTTQGDIKLTIFAQTIAQSYLLVGNISTPDGDVIIDAKGGIRAADANSLISADHIELNARAGDIDIVVDSLSGIAAWAKQDIHITEMEGDIKLINSGSWEAQGSIVSTEGDVTLETLNGSIIDALYEESRIDIALEENPLDPELQSQLAGENLSGDRVTYATSPSLIGAIYPHRELPDSFKGVTVAETANIKGVNVTFIVGGTDRNIGYTSGRVSIVNPADFDALTETEK